MNADIASRITEKLAEVVGPAIVNGAAAAAQPNDLAAEIARLKAENDALKTNPKGKAKSPESSQPVAAQQVTAPPSATPAETLLLQAIHKFKTTDPKHVEKLKPGQIPGTFAVKVHGYFHSCGVPEEKIREVVKSAEDKGIISKQSIPTKSGVRMMLYFDAKERPAYARDTVSQAEKATAAAAFGL